MSVKIPKKMSNEQSKDYAAMVIAEREIAYWSAIFDRSQRRV